VGGESYFQGVGWAASAVQLAPFLWQGTGWKTAFAINCESVNERQKYTHTHTHTQMHTHARTEGKNNANDIQTNKSILISATVPWSGEATRTHIYFEHIFFFLASYKCVI